MKTKWKQALIRLNKDEYQKIKNDSEYSGESIAKLLKRNYFESEYKIVSKEEKIDLKKLKAELNRVGNNLNQLVRNINCGLLAGWNQNVDKILEEFEKLNRSIQLR